MNRKYISSIFAVIILFSGRVSAQIDIERDTTRWLDSEIYEERNDKPTYSWTGGGFSVGYFTPNLDKFNADLAVPFVDQEVKNTVLLFGGQGFIPFPYIRNIRIGGMGYGGKTEKCCVDYTAASGQNLTRSITYSLGYGGMMLDYALPLGWNRINVLVGTELALGGVDIEVKQAAKRTFFDISKEFDSPTTNITHTYSSSFFLYKPRVILEYAPTNFLMFALSAGYQGTSMGTWKVDGDVDLGDTAKLDPINASGLIIHLSLNIGFFQ
jgi:hypothetical protein